MDGERAGPLPISIVMDLVCRHLASADLENGGMCTHEPAVRSNRRAIVSMGFCLTECGHYDGPPRGIGDVARRLFDLIPIPTCAGCVSRQMALNRFLPLQAFSVEMVGPAGVVRVSGRDVRSYIDRGYVFLGEARST